VLRGHHSRAGHELSLTQPALPPFRRSRVALRLTAAAALGRFELQRCTRCSTVQYPPRESCSRCLSVELVWGVQSGRGELIAETRLHHSHEPYFRQHLPWRVGLVRLEAGPTIVAHVHRSVPAPPAAVQIIARLDRAGHAALVARSPGDEQTMNDDPNIREMSCDPRGLNVLITDATTAVGETLVSECIAAGAQRVWAGEPPGRSLTMARSPSILVAQLDVTDNDSVRRAAATLGATIDILINSARPAAEPVADRVCQAARAQMEVNYFGLLNLSEHFEPLMLARAATGRAAWVNLLSVYAICSLPSQPAASASMAAAMSFSQAQRARVRAAGLRVVNVFAGPIAPGALAGSVIAALREGVEDAYPGELAQDLLTRWLHSSKVLERQLEGL